jgi:hypothetical protein
MRCIAAVCASAHVGQRRAIGNGRVASRRILAEHYRSKIALSKARKTRASSQVARRLVTRRARRNAASHAEASTIDAAVNVHLCVGMCVCVYVYVMSDANIF